MDSRFDPAIPHAARVYNFWLGGKDHHEADRNVGEEVRRLRPQIVAGVHANRYFLARVVRYLAAGCGIRQFLDIGTGLPAPDSTHEVAQAIAPECRIVYADNDPLVLLHARARLISAPEGSCGYLNADLRDTAAILAAAAAALDFTRPVAVLLLAVLQLIGDADDPAGVVAALAGPLAPGSHVAISHMTADFAPGPVAAAVAAYNAAAPVPVTARSHAEVTALFGGLSLVALGWCPSPGGGPTPLIPWPSPLTCTAAWPARQRAGYDQPASRPGPDHPGPPPDSPPLAAATVAAGHHARQPPCPQERRPCTDDRNH